MFPSCMSWGQWYLWRPSGCVFEKAWEFLAWKRWRWTKFLLSLHQWSRNKPPSHQQENGRGVLSGQSLRLDLGRRCTLEVRSLRRQEPHLLQTHSDNWMGIQVHQVRLINGSVHWLSHSPTQQTFKEHLLSTSVNVRAFQVSSFSS